MIKHLVHAAFRDRAASLASGGCRIAALWRDRRQGRHHATDNEQDAGSISPDDAEQQDVPAPVDLRPATAEAFANGLSVRVPTCCAPGEWTCVKSIIFHAHSCSVPILPQVHGLDHAAAAHLAQDCVRGHMRDPCMPSFANQTQCVSCVEPNLFAIVFLRRCRHTSYHRQTKDHWARDDPAFVVILAGIVAVTSAAYAAACVQSG